jgi:hypothetical protein
MMPREAVIYNLDDEELDFRFNSKRFVLPPGEFTKVPEAAVGPMLTQVGDLGAVVVPESVVKDKTKLKSVIDEAESRYVEGTRKWAEALVLDSLKANKDRVAAGLTPVEDTEVAKARAWLKKRGFAK